MPIFEKTADGYVEISRPADDGASTNIATLDDLNRIYPPLTNAGRSAPVGLQGGPFTTYDCDGMTWSPRGEGGSAITVVDSLTSTSATAALSARQGKTLAGLINAPVTGTFSNVIQFDQPYRSLGQINVTSDLTITANATGRVLLNGAAGVFIGDGTHTVTLSADFRLLDGTTFDPTVRNTLVTWDDGGTTFPARWVN